MTLEGEGAEPEFQTAGEGAEPEFQTAGEGAEPAIPDRGRRGGARNSRPRAKGRSPQCEPAGGPISSKSNQSCKTAVHE